MLFLLFKGLVADGSTLSAQFCRVDLLLRIFRIWNSFDLRSWLNYFIIGKQLVTFLMCIICGKGYTRYLIFLIWKEGGYVSVGYKFESKKICSFKIQHHAFWVYWKTVKFSSLCISLGFWMKPDCNKQSYFSFNLITRLSAPLCSIDILTSVWLTVVLTWFA